MTESAPIEIKVNLKLSGKLLFDPDTGEFDLSKLRISGSLVPTINGEDVTKPKPLRNRADDIFVMRLSNHFSQKAKIDVPGARSKAFINGWRTPILEITKQMWFASGTAFDKDFKGEKWGIVSQIATAFLINDALIKTDGLTIADPRALKKTAFTLSGEQDYPLVARDYLTKQGRNNEIDA